MTQSVSYDYPMHFFNKLATCWTGRQFLHNDVHLDVVGLEQLQLPLQIILCKRNRFRVITYTERLIRDHNTNVQVLHFWRSGGHGRSLNMFLFGWGLGGTGNASPPAAAYAETVTATSGSVFATALSNLDAAAPLDFLPGRSSANHHDYENVQQKYNDVHLKVQSRNCSETVQISFRKKIPFMSRPKLRGARPISELSEVSWFARSAAPVDSHPSASDGIVQLTRSVVLQCGITTPVPVQPCAQAVFFRIITWRNNSPGLVIHEPQLDDDRGRRSLACNGL